MLFAPTTTMRCRVEQFAMAIIGSIILSLTPEFDIFSPVRYAARACATVRIWCRMLYDFEIGAIAVA
ncbi:hypothetical protein BJ6T_45400 [Bradyrhizobium japonicum USDA 6]|nr:hypothetical protein BJ6T_45400 [Bradyrhizobium japonicum USDA 6]